MQTVSFMGCSTGSLDFWSRWVDLSLLFWWWWCLRFMLWFLVFVLVSQPLSLLLSCCCHRWPLGTFRHQNEYEIEYEQNSHFSSVPCCWSFGEKTVDRRLAWTDSYHNNDNEGEKKVMVLMVVKEETKLKGRRRRRRHKRRRRRNRGRWRQISWLFFLWIDRARSNLHRFVVSVTVRQVPYHQLW